jgi:hypothetical protein
MLMNTGIDIQMVRETYGRMTDDELTRIATQDGEGLTPEAIEVVKDEINRRGLSTNFSEGVAAQNKPLTMDDVNAYCDLLSNLKCPYCGNNTERLNGTLAAETMSFIVLTKYKRKIKIGCPRCLDKVNKDALLLSSLAGWWGFPWGIVRTIQSININIKSRRSNHALYHNQYLQAFAIGKVGELETYKQQKEKLQEVVARHNRL